MLDFRCGCTAVADGACENHGAGFDGSRADDPGGRESCVRDCADRRSHSSIQGVICNIFGKIRDRACHGDRLGRPALDVDFALQEREVFVFDAGEDHHFAGRIELIVLLEAEFVKGIHDEHGFLARVERLREAVGFDCARIGVNRLHRIGIDVVDILINLHD